MIKTLLEKLKESVFSVFPITVIVILLSVFKIVDVGKNDILYFICGAIILILGMALFNLGADIAMTPMGRHVGEGLVKTKNLVLIIISVAILGILITIAEPDLSVLANQVPIESYILILAVALGVGIFLVIGFLRTIFNIDLRIILIISYTTIFTLAFFVPKSFLPLAFDSGGVTTGPITVPFIMALGMGISVINSKDKKENSFGSIGIASIGPILAVMILSLFIKGEPTFNNEALVITDGFLNTFFEYLKEYFKTVFIALLPIAIFFFLFEAIFIKLPKKRLIRIMVGILYTFIGLVLFLTAIEVCFMPIARNIGLSLGEKSNWILILLGFILGVSIVLAEPAIHVLNKQVEELSSGTISKTSMLLSLSLGVGSSLALSMIRIIYNINILYFLIPGYLIALSLTFFVPKLYTAIAFDSGGVASGPMTAGFILPLAIGVCESLFDSSKILEGAFGIIAMVAMTPLVAIQILGFNSIIKERINEKREKKHITTADENQIFYFD